MALLSTVLVVTVMLTGDRVGFLELLMGLSLLGLVVPALRRKVWQCALVGALALAAVMWVQPGVMQRQFDSVVYKLQHFPDTDYGVVYQGGALTWLDAPMFGAGVKQYRHVCNENHGYLRMRKSYNFYGSEPITKEVVLNSTYHCGFHPHNWYLELLAETGLLGLVFFLAMLGCWGRMIWQKREVWLENPWAAGCVVMVMARLVPIVPSGSLYSIWATGSLWLMLGLLFAFLSQKESVGQPLQHTRPK